MKFITLFFNSMRIANRIDCRRFAADPDYPQVLINELCGDVQPASPERPAAVAAAVQSAWRAA